MIFMFIPAFYVSVGDFFSNFFNNAVGFGRKPKIAKVKQASFTTKRFPKNSYVG